MCQNRRFRASEIEKCSSGPKHGCGEEVSRSCLFILLIYLALYFPLVLANTNKNQQNTIKILLISST